MPNTARIKNDIDDRDLDCSAGQGFEDVNPATGKVIATVDEAIADHVDAAVTAARRALKGPWGKLTIDQRAKLLNRVADEIEANFDAFLAAEIAGHCVHTRPFDTEDEAVALANDTPYGLAAMLWTSNLGRAHQVSRQLDAGIVWVNSWFLRDLRTAFGGAKESGIGREGGIHSLEFYTELKNVCIRI